MIQVKNLTKSYGTRTLFGGVTYQFPKGEKVALVGSNGIGKTTFLNLVCSLEAFDDGEILIPDSCEIAYLPQEPNPKPKSTVRDECVAGAERLANMKTAMDDALAAVEKSPDDKNLHAYEAAESAFRNAGGYALEAKADSILTGLGFSQEQLLRDPTELSGGWRMRVELAKLFLRDPEFLILDEPTNHLDLPSLAWVENYLQTFPGTLLFVSHDRALLNRLSTITLHLDGSGLNAYRGNFDSFLDQREAKLEHEQKAADGLRKRREHMEKFVERFSAKASKATQAQSRVKMIARIRALESGLSVSAAEQSIGIKIPEPPRSPRIVCSVEDGTIGYDHPLTSGIAMTIEKGAKVAIIGANGIGKSTFLKTLAGEIPALGGKFELLADPYSYFAQDQLETLDSDQSIIDNLLSRCELGEPAARSLLGGLLFQGDDIYKEVKVLSGGEKSRVGLAVSLAQKAACLLLDEPTNHLDMGSVESLAEGLANYSGTILFVSHNREFIDQLASHIFVVLPDGRCHLFIGKIEDYRRAAKLSGFPDIFLVDNSKAPTPTKQIERAEAAPAAKQTQTHLGRKERKREQKRLENLSKKLEGEMEGLRNEVANLDAKLTTTPATAYDDISKLHQKKEAVESQISSLEEKWLGIAEELEANSQQ